MKTLFPLRRKLYSLFIIVSVFGVLGFQKAKLDTILTGNSSVDSSSKSRIALQDQALKSNLTVLKQSPSFGYRNVISDFLYLSFLQYFGDRETRGSIGYLASPLFFENIVARDPFFSEIYLFLSTSVSLYSGRPDISVTLMEQGLKSMAPDVPPDSYYIWRYKAVDELLFLGNGEAARRSHLKAAEWASLSSDPEGKIVAERSLNTAQFLAQDINSKPAQIAAWAQVLAGAVDDEARQIAVLNIEELGGTIIVDQNGRATVQYKIDNDEPDLDSPETPSQS